MGQESASEANPLFVLTYCAAGYVPEWFRRWTGLPQPKTEAECSPITSAAGHAICGPDLRSDYPLQKHT